MSFEREDDKPAPGARTPVQTSGAIGKRTQTLDLADRGGPRDPAGDAVAEARRGAGAPLPEPLRQRASAVLGGDLSAVRVHDGAASAQAADAIGARAYAVDQDIHFAGGAYQPGTPEGDHLLAH